MIIKNLDNLYDNVVVDYNENVHKKDLRKTILNSVDSNLGQIALNKLEDLYKEEVLNL